MSFLFQNLQLEASSLYSIIAVPAAMQLVVSEQEAVIHGDGYPQEVAAAFSALIPDWEAKIVLPAGELELIPGSYDLIYLEGELFACAAQRKVLVADLEVRVIVILEEEREEN